LLTPHEFGVEQQGPLQLRPVVDLDQHVHAEPARRRLQLRGLPVAQAGHDEQHGVGADRAASTTW
jgi:hypothetical protein